MADDETEGQPSPTVPESGAPSLEAAPGPDAAAPPEPVATNTDGEALTEHGYAYSVVGADADAVQDPAQPEEKREGTGWPHPALLALLVLVPVAITAVVVWFAVGAMSDGSDDRSSPNVASMLNQFTGQGADFVVRYEGASPPGFPADIPEYPGATLVASVLQVAGENAAYFVVYDTTDSREDVAAYLQTALDTDPWQVDGAQDDRDSTAAGFTKIDDPDIEGFVVAAESLERAVTTIFLSVQVTGGADDADTGEFELPVSRPLPPEFPADFPQYPEAIVIQSAYQQAPAGNSYAVSLIARADAADVIDFYREELTGAGYTVEDADPEGSGLEDATAITLLSEDGVTSGSVVAGTFAEDRNYVQIDVQVSLTE